MSFVKAEKRGLKLRMALLGPPGSGKTKTGMKIISRLCQLESSSAKWACIDTERESSCLYSDEFDFDVNKLEPPYSAEKYIEAVQQAGEAGYAGLFIDSGSHAWAGPGGVLEFVDNVTAKDKFKDKFGAWRQGTPLQNRFIDALLAYPGHLIMTMRTKMAYEKEVDPSTGKNKVVKLGLQPIQREGMEYEFTVVADIDMDHNLMIGKTRCSAIDGQVFAKDQSKTVADTLHKWLNATTVKAASQGQIDQLLQLAEGKGYTLTNLLKAGKVKDLKTLSEPELAALVTRIEAAPNKVVLTDSGRTA